MMAFLKGRVPKDFSQNPPVKGVYGLGGDPLPPFADRRRIFFAKIIFHLKNTVLGQFFNELWVYGFGGYPLPREICVCSGVVGRLRRFGLEEARYDR